MFVQGRVEMDDHILRGSTFHPILRPTENKAKNGAVEA